MNSCEDCKFYRVIETHVGGLVHHCEDTPFFVDGDCLSWIKRVQPEVS